MPVVPDNVTKESTEQYSYTFSGWDKSVVPVNGSVIYVAQFTPVLRTYTLTFLRADGSVIKTVNNQPYGSIPTDDAHLVPALIPKSSDASYHYTAAWDNNIRAAITGDTTYQIVYTPVAHSWGSWTTQSAPGCESYGSESRTCKDCSYAEVRGINPTGHDMVLLAHNPANEEAGYLYYACANDCGRVAKCAVDESGNPSMGDICAQEDLPSQSAAVPTTQFNTYISELDNYNYFNRGAALRIDYDSPDDVQAMRFIGSMVIPENVEIVDFGYVYTREDKFRTLAKFVIGGPNVQCLSVAEGKYSDHQTATGTVRTFNLVLNIEKQNWHYLYLARTYITYKYAGQTFTVYDNLYANRSVNFVAEKIMQSATESRFNKEYVENKIING